MQRKINKVGINWKRNLQWIIPSIIVYLILTLYILLSTLRFGVNISYQVFISPLAISFLPLGYIYYRKMQNKSHSVHLINVLITAAIFCTLLLGDVYLENISLGLPFDIYSYIAGVIFFSLIAVVGYALWIFFFRLSTSNVYAKRLS